MGLGLFYYTQENRDILFGQTQHPRGMIKHGWVKIRQNSGQECSVLVEIDL